jgi:hypothetical protein
MMEGGPHFWGENLQSNEVKVIVMNLVPQSNIREKSLFLQERFNKIFDFFLIKQFHLGPVDMLGSDFYFCQIFGRVILIRNFKK